MNGPSPAIGSTTVEALLRFYDERGYHGRIGPGQAPALLIIDFSLAFTSGRSTFPGGHFEAEIAQTQRLIEAFRAQARPVLFTTIAYANPGKEAGWWAAKVPWLEHCRLDSPLVAIDPRIAPAADEPVIVKPYPSSFFRTDLHERLHALKIDTLVIAGCTTSVCVRATAIDAMQHGYRPLLAAEAIGEFDPALHALHLRDIDARYADVCSVDMILDNMGQDDDARR